MYKPEVTVRIDSYSVVANNPYSQEGVVAGVNALLNVLYIGFYPYMKTHLPVTQLHSIGGHV